MRSWRLLRRNIRPARTIRDAPRPLENAATIRCGLPAGSTKWRGCICRRFAHWNAAIEIRPSTTSPEVFKAHAPIFADLKPGRFAISPKDLYDVGGLVPVLMEGAARRAAISTATASPSPAGTIAENLRDREIPDEPGRRPVRPKAPLSPDRRGSSALKGNPRAAKGRSLKVRRA